MEKFRKLERKGYNFQVEEASNIFELLYCQPDFEGKLPWCPDWDGVIAEYVLEESDEEDNEHLEDSSVLESVPHSDFEGKLPGGPNWPDDGLIEENVVEKNDEKSKDLMSRKRPNSSTSISIEPVPNKDPIVELRSKSSKGAGNQNRKRPNSSTYNSLQASEPVPRKAPRLESKRKLIKGTKNKKVSFLKHFLIFVVF